jgi:parvulin-like peptidyl-prolyl isomerase
VVVEVGKSQLTLAELEQRLGSLPRYQLESLGKKPAEVKKAFLDAMVVPELLFAEEARRRKLEKSLTFHIATREVLRAALEREVRSELAEKNPVSDQDVAHYYEQHRAEYEKPTRLRLFRILVKDEDEARKLLERAKKSDLVAWRELARKHSTDAATRERGGDLGFVHPDGSTDVPRVRTLPALYEAAAQLDNGALAPEPVREGEQFAVVWRRGSLDASDAGLEAYRTRIRRMLEEDRVRQALAKLGTPSADLKTSNVELLEELELPVFGSSDPKARVRIEGKPGADPRPSAEAVPGGAR